MRIHLLLLLLVLSAGLGGCSAVRGVGFYGLALANSPLPPGAARTEIENAPFLSFGTPAAYVFVKSPDTAASVLDFYRQTLRARGWTESEQSRTREAPTGNEKSNFHDTYYFQRQSALGWGDCKWVYAREKLDLYIVDLRLLDTPHEETEVHIEISGHYAWDAPGTFLATSLLEHKTGAVAWMLLFVTIPF